MFSFGIEPSITSTNGASSSSTSAWRNGLRNSSPPSVGESTLLWRCTFGSPGIAPSRTSSIPGCPAAVMETLSPSHDIPSEIHRMWTSSTPGPMGSGVMPGASVRHRHVHVVLLELERVDEQLLAAQQLEVEPAAGRTPQRESGQLALAPAGPAPPGGRNLDHHQLRTFRFRALRHQLEGEGERVGHHLAQ